ncbi:uncharacterized protein I206_100059 [Kwoniella pini CBS 10737]|uniref:Uncharacterized protein n=1 Tax=Kwoniella pini CBS 10737 TaxID=1296096 RepID=A0A1B9HSF0_9TREE|nr:uncharacterized protein I206_07874 [Kwoniella pini CBS 10737]OCF46203.1 hypothetical protein I206_07874 [Kwoniella pini CBS 10737]
MSVPIGQEGTELTSFSFNEINDNEEARILASLRDTNDTNTENPSWYNKVINNLKISTDPIRKHPARSATLTALAISLAFNGVLSWSSMADDKKIQTITHEKDDWEKAYYETKKDFEHCNDEYNSLKEQCSLPSVTFAQTTFHKKTLPTTTTTTSTTTSTTDPNATITVIVKNDTDGAEVTLHDDGSVTID